MGKRLCKKLWYAVAMSILSILYFSNSLHAQCMAGDIGGTVFRELPANGLGNPNVYGTMDANESGLAGITVTVTDANDVVLTTTTDFRGDWWITPASYPVRVEFSWTDIYLEATTGVTNNQIVRIENAADCAVNLGVQYPIDYAQAMPEVIVNCYVPGDPLGGGTSGTLDAVVTFPYGRTGALPEPDKDALMSEVGATWGLAYNPYTEVAFTSAVLKRHVGLGSLGIGGIYAIDYSSATPVTTPLVDLAAMGINLGTEPARNLAIDFDTPESDSLMFDAPGKMGMGDLDISDDGQTLYVVNLNDKEVVAIDLTTYNASGTLPTMSEVSSLGLIPSPGCAFGASRPFGLKYYQGQLYAGVVCSGENGGTAIDLSATVYAYDFASSTWNTALATFPLDYTRGEVVGGSCTQWEPWIDTYDGDFENCSPSPLLSSLDFDVDGSMIMAFTDRYTLQKFTFQRNLTDTQSETVISGGELLRASISAGSFVLENAGTTVNGGGCGNNGEGPGGGEFYCGDLIDPDHYETVMGAIAILPGTEDAIVTVMNPIDGTFNSGGVKMFNNNDGTSANGYLLYQTTTFPGGNGNAVKGGGLGDIELLKDPAPVEICSHLWIDSDNDGSYDAGETGLSGIEISLMATDGTTVETTTTDANGQFCFNNNLAYFTDYYVTIGTSGDFDPVTGIIQDSLSLTFPNNTSGPTADLHDSDAVIASGVNPNVDGYPYLTFNTGGGGTNTNDLATGFSVSVCPVIDSPSAPQTVCSGDTIPTLQVGTDATEDDAIVYVYFADQQTGSDMYTGGTSLDTITPSGGIATINNIVLPINNTASAEDYFIYAIANPAPGDVNCRPFAEIIITVAPAPVVSVSSNSPVCEGGDIMLNETGGAATDWNWQGPSFSAGSIQNPSILNASTTDNGMYYVTITDASGCTNVDSTFVSVTGSGSITFGNTGPFCIMETPSNITAVPSGGTFTGSGITDAAAGTFDPAIAGMGVTTITYNFTDGNGCSGSGTVDITVLASPTVTLDGAGPFCVTDQDTLLLGQPAGGTYSGVGIIDGTNGRFDPGVAGPGTHTISYTFTNAQNCSETATTDITVGAIPSVSLDGAGPFCRSNPPVVLNGTPAGGLFYGVGITDTMAGVFDPSLADAGTNMIQYVFHHPDGCSNVAFTEITVPVPDIQITAAGPFCATDAATILNATPSGGTFSGTGITNGASGIFDPGAAGSGNHLITYEYTDTTGCTGSGTINIMVSDCNGDFGDFVWIDANNNGIQEIGEAGLGNLTVNLYDANTDMLVSTTTTDNMGMYLFSGFTSGDYYIIFDTTGIGEQYMFSPMDIGTDDLDSDANAAGQTPDFMGTTGFDVLDIDAGLVPVADLGDFVFNDLDNNGVQDPGEPGIEGVTINLYDANTDMIIATTTTDANGNYVFDRIPPGDYYIGYDPTTNTNGDSFVFAPQDAGMDDDLDSDIDPSTGFTPDFTFDPTAGDVTDIDAGFIQSGSIGDLVFADYNGDGIQDPGEPGIAGVMVILNDPVGVPLDTVFTDVNGNYTIDGITAGDYFISFDNTTNTDGNTFLGTPINAGTDDTLDSDIDPVAARTPVFTFDPTTGNDIDTDAGFIPVMTIGDFVFEDVNENGVQDPGETGIEGVTVTLYNAADDSVVSTTTTDAMGLYSFPNTPSGNYYLGFDESTNTNGDNLTGSPQDATSDDFDSDIDPLTNTTTSFIVDPLNGDDLDMDAGFYQLTIFSVGNFVWQDNNGNGVQDPGEPGLNNVDVFLADAATDALIGSATTDASGAYQIDNVPAGNYYLFFDNSNYPTYMFSPQDAAGDDALDSDADAGGQTADFTITNANDFDFDAGLIPNIITNTIGDFVFEDLDADGMQDAGEPGIEGVTVNLFNSADSLIATTTTDATGSYSFTNIPAGDYYINFDETTNTAGNTYNISPPGVGADDQDSDINPVNGSTAIFTFDPTMPNNDMDAGFFQPTVHMETIGDFVFEDLDEDGMQDAGEPGIEGVTVSLFNSADSLIATTMTDAVGAYSFDNILAGDYYVNFDETTNTAGNTYNTSPPGVGADDQDSDVNPVNGSTAIFTFDALAPNNDIDAGFFQPAVPTNTIGDFVFEDINENGIQDPGEPGIEGVTVTLNDDTGMPIATTTTDATGAYEFTGVAAGDYSVSFDPTTNTGGTTFVPTSMDAGADNVDSDIDGSGNTVTFTFDPSAPNEDIDAGFVQPMVPTNTIGDFVFEDINENGIQDPGEPGIEGVTVTLNDDTGMPIATTTTDATGAYEFTGVAAGDYSVSFDPTTNTGGNTFVPTSMDAGADNIDSDIDGSGNTVTFTFDPSAPNEDIDAGFVQPMVPTNTIGDFVFEDINENGIQDPGEPGIEGVTVTLNDDTGMPIATTMTDATGAYEFTGVAAGDYSVSFDPTTNAGGTTFVPTSMDAGADNIDSDIDGSGNTVTFTFDPSAPNEDIDAGFVQPMVPTNTIGDFVFEDINENGIQDPGEPGIEGVTVTLNDDTGMPIATTMTDATGAYEFTGVAAGDYSVSFDATTNTGGTTFVPTSMDAGADNADSDIDASGNTVTFTFDALAPNEDIDAGFFQPTVPTNSIGDFVFQDVNGDGIQDMGEPGIEGVTVTLFDDMDNEVATTTTDANGAYNFDNIPAGDYYVNFDETTNTAGNTFVNSPPGQTSDDADSDVVDQITNNTMTFTFDALAPNNDIDAGFVLTNSIGDFVFEDTNENGIQEMGELGIEGVTVTLFNDMDIEIGTTTTDANGAYIFNNIPAGNYYVIFDVTTNTAGNTYATSPQDVATTTEGLDSDINATGSTQIFTFDASAPNNDIDAGFFQGCPVIDAGPNVSICEGFSTTLNATMGGDIYLWSPTATLDNPGSPTPVATPTETTTYYLNVTGTCSGMDSVIVFVNPQPVVDMVNSVDPSACDAMDGSIQITASGGQAPLQYSIDGGMTFSTNNTFSNLTSGNYDVLIANADSTCLTAPQLVTLTQDAISCPVLFSNDTLLVADGRAPTVCIPVSIDDTMSYEITVNGALYTDPITGCTVDTLATPGMEINLGGIGIYEIAFNNTSTCCQDTLTLAVQGTIQPDTLFEVTPFETTTATLCADTSDLVGNFATLALCQTPSNGTANLDGSSCITYTPDAGFVGTDTLCLVACDEFGACDTTVMFIQVQTENCPDFITLENEMITLADCNDNGTICVNIDLADLNQYSIFDNGNPYAGGIQACRIDTLTYYDYSGLPGAGLTGPYTIDNWTVNGNSFSATVADMESLKDSMNVWDPTGNWIHVPANNEIRHVLNTDMYSRIDLTEVISGAPGIMNPQQRNQPVDIELSFGAGTHEVIFREIATGCEDTVNVELTCMCPPLFAADTVTVAAADCDEMAFYCTPILLTEFINYNVSDNGNPYTQQIEGCDFDSLIIYNYDNFPGQGNNGPYTLDSWIVDGQTFNMDFNTIPQLVDSMNVWDPNGNWFISNNFSIDGGDLTRDYGAITIVQFGIVVAVSPADLQPTPSKVSLPLSVGFHELIFENTTDGCIDTIYINAECNDCPEYFMDDMLTLDAGDCADSTELCISVLPADITNYTITDNGAVYTNGFAGCDFDSIQSYLTVSFNNTGTYQMDNWMINGIAFGPLTFTDPAVLADSMNVIDPTGNWNYSGLLITGGAELNTYGDLIISENGMPLSTVSPSPILRANGTAMLLDTGFHVVIVTDDISGCADTIDVQVDCTPAPDCPDFISVASQMLLLDDCNEDAIACVPVPINDAIRFTITDNGMPYGTMLTACGADTVLIYETENVPGSSSYNLEEWTVNGMMFSGQFEDLNALADSMRLWDAGSNWIYDQVAETLTGANADNTYGTLNIRHLVTNSFVVLETVDMMVGGGTNLALAAGFHEVIFERPDGCMDTVAITAICPNPDTILTDLVIGITDTICLDTFDLAGNIIDIDNICTDASGTSTSVNFLDGFTCIEVTGIEVGMDTACIVLCDDLGMCDTTTFIFNTISDQVSPPTANPDTANTVIEFSVDVVVVNNDDAGNQPIDTFFIVDGPDNGSAFLNPETGLLTYTPFAGYCNDNIPDMLTYGLCNASGCDTSTVTIFVECDTLQELIIHNGFSPNNDGVNDVFMIQGLRNFPNNSLCVFNRWGNQVYRKDAYGFNESGQYDENTLWNGTWTEQVLPDGTYFYLLDDGNGNRFSGYVQIHR